MRGIPGGPTVNAKTNRDSEPIVSSHLHPGPQAVLHFHSSEADKPLGEYAVRVPVFLRQENLAIPYPMPAPAPQVQFRAQNSTPSPGTRSNYDILNKQMPTTPHETSPFIHRVSTVMISIVLDPR